MISKNESTRKEQKNNKYKAQLRIIFPLKFLKFVRSAHFQKENNSNLITVENN